MDNRLVDRRSCVWRFSRRHPGSRHRAHRDAKRTRTGRSHPSHQLVHVAETSIVSTRTTAAESQSHPRREDDRLPTIEHVALNPQWLAGRTEPILEPERRIVDPHHHLWERDGGYLLDELLADVTSGHRIDATVFVQCGYHYYTSGPEALRPVGETEWVASVGRAAHERGIGAQVCAGIVGYADLTLGDAVDEVLHAHIGAGDGRFRGIRHSPARDEAFATSLLSRPPIDLLQQASFRRGLARLQAAGMSFDAWVYHPQLPQLVDLAREMPDLPIVLNHVGGPLGAGPYRGRRDEVFADWHASIEALAAMPNVSIKLGGLAMAIGGFDFHLGRRPPSSDALAAQWKPLIHGAIEAFGAGRCMFESNFPVDKGMCSYAILWNAFKRLASGASEDEKSALFFDTANRFYRLGLA
ncbi:MAG: amidohydrolase [Lautropia sp.]